MNVLGISGSLRTASVSTALLKSSATLVSGHVKLTIYDGLGDLPHFNPEIDREFAPPAISNFRSQLNNSAGVIISTPEYAHGIPGVLKNALDWLVASGELYEKPVALFSASPRGRFAHASLIETLMVMMARLIPEAFINVSPPLGMGNGEPRVAATADLSTRVERALGVFVKAIDLPYSESKFASGGTTIIPSKNPASIQVSGTEGREARRVAVPWISAPSGYS